MIPFLFIFLIVLNPYTVIGPLAYYVAAPFFFIAIIFGGRLFDKKIVFAFFVFILISLVGVLSSLLHNIYQLEHLKVAVSVLIYYFVGIGFFIAFQKKIANLNDILLFSIYVCVINSFIIILQVNYPQLRVLVESFFVGSGNIDWTDGFRYRGLASGGGASLSLLVPFCVYIALYLLDAKRISIFHCITIIIIMVTSVFFVGRTGVVILPFVFIFFAIIKGRSAFGFIALWSGLILALIYFGFEYLKEFLTKEYGEGFYRYTLGYFLEGKDGINEEGTVGTVFDFLTVLPTQFPEILIGYGFYGGSDFIPWTDSGYARMFLSVGFFFGALFYATSIYIFRNSVGSYSVLFLPLVGILMLAEAKEGLLFSGYSSRLLFILLGFASAMQRMALFNLRASKFVKINMAH